VYCIQTDIGHTFVCEHHQDFDAQECWKKTTTEAHKSTHAELEVTALQDKLMQARIDSNWHGTVTGFLLYWKDTLCKMEDILPVQQHYPKLMKKRLLHSAVNGHPHLASVDKMDQDQVAHGMKSLDFQEYFDILMSAAAQVDHQNNLGSNQRQSKHVVNYLDLTPEEYSDLSSPLDQLSIHRTQAREPDQKPKAAPDPDSLYVPYAVWEQLPPRVQALIRDACGKQPSGGNKARLAKFHDVYAATSDDLAPDIEEDNIVTSDIIQEEDAPSDSNDSQKIAAHLTNHHVLEPNDIRHVLTTSQKRREKEITQRAAKKTIVVDGVTYTANVHNVVYNVSELLTSIKLPLLTEVKMVAWLVKMSW